MCVCECLLWQEWSKIWQKSTSILQSKCVFVNLWFFFSARNRCWCECESELVWWVRIYMYSLVWQQCTSEKLFFLYCCWFYYRYDFLCTEKSGKNSHLLNVKWFEDHNFNSKVVLVIRFLVCCQFRVASDLRAVLPVVLEWNLSQAFWESLGQNKTLNLTQRNVHLCPLWTTIVISGFIFRKMKKINFLQYFFCTQGCANITHCHLSVEWRIAVWQIWLFILFLVDKIFLQYFARIFDTFLFRSVEIDPIRSTIGPLFPPFRAQTGWEWAREG